MSETIQTLILSAHILVGILLVGIILIQRGKGSDAGMAFGGGASGTVFGAAGSGTFLTKTTKWLAVAFFSTSLGLAYVHNNTVAPESVLDRIEQGSTDNIVPDSLEIPGAEIAPSGLPNLPEAAPVELPNQEIPSVEPEQATEAGEELKPEA